MVEVVGEGAGVGDDGGFSMGLFGIDTYHRLIGTIAAVNAIIIRSVPIVLVIARCEDRRIKQTLEIIFF